MTQCESLKISVLADLHYKKGMYISSVEDVRRILARAHENGADFVMHVGDMCNDYRRSPELTDAYLNNEYGLPAYGIYGNHELESCGNSMELVTPMLCNHPVIWGTSDGELGDGSVGYYYFDIKSFRIIGLDTNYSLTPNGVWEHNRTASWGAPAENTKKDCLGDVQLKWLERVLTNAAEQGLCCLIFSHMGFSGIWQSSGDGEQVRELIRRVNGVRRGTVLVCASGHLHTDHQAVVDGVLHLDVNTARNGLWLPEVKEHYGNMTYNFVDYDENGKERARYDRPLKEAWMSEQTWFFDRPLSALLTVETNGKIEIKGESALWYGGIEPDPKHGAKARISSGAYILNEDNI